MAVEAFAFKVGEALISQSGIATGVIAAVAIYFAWLYNKARVANESNAEAWRDAAREQTAAEKATTAVLNEIKGLVMALLARVPG